METLGRFKDIFSRENTVQIIYSPSNMLTLKIYDWLKQEWGIETEDTELVQTIQKIHSMEKKVYLSAMNSDRWLLNIKYTKIKKHLQALINLLILGQETSLFLIEVANYGEYKELNKAINKARLDGVNFNYLAWLRADEIGWIINQTIKDNGLQKGVVSPKAMEFLQKGYGNEPDKILEICERIKNGETFADRKSVVEAVGVSSGSTDRMIFNLLKDPPKNVKLVVKNRLKVLNEMASIYGVGKTQNFLRSGVKKLIDLKLLYLNGRCYKKVENNLPEPYRFEELRRYSRYLEDIKGIPLERFVRLYMELNKTRWENSIHMQSFLYNYYIKDSRKV